MIAVLFVLILAAIGAGCIVAGIAVLFGVGWALIAGGLFALGFAVVGSRGVNG